MNSTKRDNKENSSHFRIFIYGILFICAIFFTLLTCFLFQNQYGQHQSMLSVAGGGACGVSRLWQEREWH